MSEITGDSKYVEKVEKIREVIVSSQRPKNLYPNYLNPKTGKWGQQHTSVGALGDSFYEYLLKEWLRSGKRDRQVSNKRYFTAKNLKAFFLPAEFFSGLKNGLAFGYSGRKSLFVKLITRPRNCLTKPQRTSRTS